MPQHGDITFLSQGGEGQYQEKKSRFIGRTFPVESEQEALDIIQSEKKKYWDARHSCYAFRTDGDSVSERFSDDGEPSGTAGKPILSVLQSRDIHNVLLIVTRYFGGVLLGTGGLVRAYTAASVSALDHSVLGTKVYGRQIDIRMDYNSYGKIERYCRDQNIMICNSDFAADVRLSCICREEQCERLAQTVQEVTRAEAGVTMSDPGYYDYSE